MMDTEKDEKILIHEKCPQKGMLTLNDLEFSNKKFWTGFVAASFPTALDEETDMLLSEMIDRLPVQGENITFRFSH